MESKEFKKRILPLGQNLYRFAAGLLKDSHEAEDVVQDIFLKLWNMREKIGEINNLNAFAYRMTRNICLDKLKGRRIKYYDDTGHGIPEPEVSDPDPQSLVEMRDSADQVRNLICNLPEQQKAIIHLRDIDGYSYEEISEIMSMEINTIRVALSRARRTVRESLIKMQEPWKI
jgi:RNA polymerase sigma-70 factor (ECF subfamily)